MKKNNNKGFTLMEMLIVVAIIAVLVAIAIPVFTNSLEKAREATDAANLRSAYAECAVAMLSDTTDAKGYSKKVDPVQTVAGFAHLGDDAKIADVTIKGNDGLSAIKKGTPVYVNYAADGTLTFTASVATDFTELK